MPVTTLIDKSPEPSDEQLLELMRVGDMQAFNTLFKRHSQRGVEIASTIVRDHFTAEEVVSDVFFNFWARRLDLPVIPLFQSYLFTAIRYRARKMRSLKTGEAETVSLDNDDTTQPEDAAADPFMQLQAGELANTLQQWIEQLPAQRKLIFKLSRMNGLSYKAIADILQLSESTVKNQLAAALKTLRANLSVYSHSLPMLLAGWLCLATAGLLLS